MSTNKIKFVPDSAIFSPVSKISILLYVVAKRMQKFSRFNPNLPGVLCEQSCLGKNLILNLFGGSISIKIVYKKYVQIFFMFTASL
jgi:hypothetical protein